MCSYLKDDTDIWSAVLFESNLSLPYTSQIEISRQTSHHIEILEIQFIDILVKYPKHSWSAFAF